MAQRSRLHTTQSGISGEYFVAGELSRLGYIASLSLKNTQGIDVLATSHDASRQVAIQVKTNQGDGSEWMLGEKAERMLADSFFYVFVRLHGLGQPEYFVVPSKEVAKYVRDSHRRWLRTPGLHGQKHRDTPMRKFAAGPDSKYKDAWHLLGLGPPAA